ncbi:MAG: hypothetical protein HOJ35_06050 [Bdellovibrionales bacterium]|nr:hypothetical protein [Bdellovibrionales bacterium]
MTPIAIILGTTIHEGSHVLMAKSFGADIKEFRVIPFTENGSTYMGRMSYTYDSSWTGKHHAFVSAAPMITDTVITGVCSSLAFSGNLPENRWGKTALNVMCLMPTIDLITHIMATSPSSDLVKLEERISDGSDLSLTQARVITRVPMALTIASGVAASSIMLYDLLRPPVKNNNENKVIHNLRVAPTISGSFNGATLQFEF